MRGKTLGRDATTKWVTLIFFHKLKDTVNMKVTHRKKTLGRLQLNWVRQLIIGSPNESL